MFLTPTDFTGFYAISNGGANQNDKIEDYIAEYEPDFLRDLLGVELYDLFVADLDPITGLPVTARFLDIYNAIYLDDDSCIRISKGMKEMLKGFVYFNIVRDSDFHNTISGNVKNEFSNASSVTTIQMGLNERYNVAVGYYNTIQWFICENSSVYPEYNGQSKEVEVWL